MVYLSSLHPSLDHDLALRKEADRFLSLGMEYAKEGVLHPAEGEEGHRGDDTDIDTDVTAGGPVLELTGTATVGGKDGIAIAVVAGITHLNGFIQVICPHDTHQRAKDFFAADPHPGINIFKNGRSDKAGIGITALNLEVFSAIQKQLGSLLNTAFNITDHPVLFGFIPHRAHLNTFIQSVTYRNFRSRLNYFIHETLIEAFVFAHNNRFAPERHLWPVLPKNEVIIAATVALTLQSGMITIKFLALA